jgi:uncharacterized protein (TIGR02145 family)
MIEKQINKGFFFKVIGIAFIFSSVIFLSCKKKNDKNPLNPLNPSTSETGSMTGNDSKIYRTVRIGNQWWMAENLRETKYRNGNQIPNITDSSTWAGLSSGARCSYHNNESNVSVYGCLYNQYAVQNRWNIAPAGWHVPTDEEWKTLEKYLGMSQSEVDDYGWRGTNEGGKLKETGTSHWQSPKTGATNESGFSGLPGGCRHSGVGSFDYLGTNAYFWSATQLDACCAWGRSLVYFYSIIQRSSYEGHHGLSVRLVRDNWLFI